MSEDNAKGVARPSQPETTLFTGEWPDDARPISVKVWAERVFGVTEDAINKWIAEYDIPFKLCPGGRFVRGVDFWSALPFCKPSENTHRGRGGSRKKKEQ